MQRLDMDPEDGGASGSPRTSDRPPVGEPLVVSRHRPPDPEPEAEQPVPVPTGPLSGRTGLVTGATGELGAAFAGALAERGARVVLVDADLAGLRRTSSHLPGSDPALILRCDLGSADDVEAACDFLRRSGAHLDLVVHAASVDESLPVIAGPVESLDEQYLISVRAPSLLSRHLSDSMAPGASVVFVDRDPGDGGHDVRSQRTVLAAARQGLVDVLRAELGSGDIRLLAASCGESSAASDVADVVLDVAVRGGSAKVTALRVEDGTVIADPALPGA